MCDVQVRIQVRSALFNIQRTQARIAMLDNPKKVAFSREQVINMTEKEMGDTTEQWAASSIVASLVSAAQDKKEKVQKPYPASRVAKRAREHEAQELAKTDSSSPASEDKATKDVTNGSQVTFTRVLGAQVRALGDAPSVDPASGMAGGVYRPLSHDSVAVCLVRKMQALEHDKPRPALCNGRSFKDEEEDDASTVFAEDKPNGRLRCCNCHECGNSYLRWSKFLFIEGDADWQGQLWGCCLECSGMMPAAFKKLARRRKEDRAQALRGKRDRARCINMANAAEVISKMFPKASCALVRELAIMRTKAVASAFNMAYDRSTK